MKWSKFKRSRWDKPRTSVAICARTADVFQITDGLSGWTWSKNDQIIDTNTYSTLEEVQSAVKQHIQSGVLV